MPKAKAKPVFKRVLGDFGATAISIGAIIGSGIFFIIGMAAGDAGPGIIFSLIIAGIIAGFTALSFASLGSKIPKEGGEYQFVYEAFGEKIGFLAGLFWIGATAIAGVTVSIAMASYISAIFPVAPVHVLAAIACIAFMLIDTVGIRISSKVNSALVVVKVGVLILFILICAPFISFSNFADITEKGAGGITSAAFLIFFAYAGFGKITAAAEEVKDPKRTIPIAIIAGVLIATVLYIGASVAAVGVVGAEKLASPGFRNAPFAHVIRSIGIPGAFQFIALGAIAATASVLLIQMLGLSRTIYAMSKNRQLPEFLSELHPKFKTPFKAELLIGAGMALAALALDARSVIELTSLGILSYYAVINLAALALKKRKGGFDVHPIIPILGFLSSVLLLSYFLWGKFSSM